MRILSIKHHLSADHSSSTYLFVTTEKLTAEERQFVHDLTGEQPRGRDIRFHYIGDWNDIPWSWVTQLVGGPYEVMVGESYDHWMAEWCLPYDAASYARAAHYACPGDMDGFEVEHVEDRIRCIFNFHVDYGSSFFNYYDDAERQVADLILDIRQEIMTGDLTALRVIYELNGSPRDTEPGREVLADDTKPLSTSAETLKNLLVIL